MPSATLFNEGATYASIDASGDIIVYKESNGDVVRTDSEQTATTVLWAAPLSSPFHQAFFPVISHDGTLVIFEFTNATTGVSELYSMSAVDGSSLTQLTTFGENNNNATMRVSFSPDDSQVVFSRDDFVAARNDLWMMDVDGSNLSLFLTFGGSITVYEPSWSIDGVIAYIRRNVSTYTIRTINPDGSGDTELATDLVTVGTELYDLTYSQDGNKLAVVQYTTGFRLVQMDADGQNSAVLYDLDEDVTLEPGYGIIYRTNNIEIFITGDELNVYIISPDRNAITFAVFNNTDFIDWEQEDAVGFDFSSYFISGYKLRGEGIRKFQTNWLKIFTNNEDPSIFDFAGRWDYSIADTSGRFTQVQRITMTEADKYRYGKRRLKVRGRGDVLQIKILSVEGQPFDITGWTCVDTVNEKP